MSDLQIYIDNNLSSIRFDDESDEHVVSFSQELLNARKSIGMSQEELSKASGIQQASISKIEKGLLNPSVKVLKKLATGMGKKLIIKFE